MSLERVIPLTEEEKNQEALEQQKIELNKKYADENKKTTRLIILLGVLFMAILFYQMAMSRATYTYQTDIIKSMESSMKKDNFIFKEMKKEIAKSQKIAFQYFIFGKQKESQLRIQDFKNAQNTAEILDNVENFYQAQPDALPIYLDVERRKLGIPTDTNVDLINNVQIMLHNKQVSEEQNSVQSSKN